MIELMQGLSDGVVGIEAVGEVSAADYDAVNAAIEDALAARRKIRLIHVLGDRDSARCGLTNRAASCNEGGTDESDDQGPHNS